MARITVITGLCGSGKTHLAERMVGVKVFNEGVRPDMSNNMQDFFDVLGTGQDCAIVEIAYIDEQYRREFVRLVEDRYPGTIIKWVCFKNDLEQANANCLNDPKRDEQKREEYIALNNRWTHAYTIPEDAVVLEIFPLPPLRET